MPTCHGLYACCDAQQEAVQRFRFGLYCRSSVSVALDRKLSVLDIAWLELLFGAFLYCYFIKTAFLTVEEGAKLSQLKRSLEM